MGVDRRPSSAEDGLEHFHPPVQRWFRATFRAPTEAQRRAWPAIVAGRSTLLLAPTGSGKTLAAFLSALDRLSFGPPPASEDARLRVLYVSPLKALGVDIARNLEAPLAGIDATTRALGQPFHPPRVGVRSGDTPSAERARISRRPPDILITTPESLYLLLTSGARAMLASVETVIVDEIHALVPTKRGAHLALSLERLEALRPAGHPLQRIGLSATQRPLEEVARFLGGGELEPGPSGRWRPRPVELVDAGSRRALDLTVEVPVEDMARPSGATTEALPGPGPAGAPQVQSARSRVGSALPGPGPAGEPEAQSEQSARRRVGSAMPASGPAGKPEARADASIWPAIHPRLVELIRAHRSTLIFVNSRRLAERLAAALNEVAGEELALAHHGSLAKDTRLEVEARLVRGEIPALVATSSLELGIDVGAIDLVVQIEAPPSVAAGMQRVGRAGHQVEAVSRGILFPKFRGDLLASAAVVERMLEGRVEASFYPRNALDILAQQVVAEVAMGPVEVEVLFRRLRGAAPFAELPRRAFEGVLDMLSGRYPADAFAELRPRITWDREADLLEGRQGARRVAVINGGTIPDRGLYGVFLAGSDRPQRVGELDEEMVFESRVGDVFLLGASSWRIEEIGQDRVLVSPAPGQPGRMPFWRGDRPARPAELGRAIGALSRALVAAPRDQALARLAEAHRLEPRAAENLLRYLTDQQAATEEVPSDEVLVLERFIDQVGDWRVCLLSPFGSRVHAPWAMAVAARLRDERQVECDFTVGDDGIVFRLPAADEAPDPADFVLAPEALEPAILREVGSSSIFAARFRESAARALLLPRRQPGRRTPLWAQRRRAADLLAVAAHHADFPIVLEAHRECLRDVFDLEGLEALLGQLERGAVRLHTVTTRAPSPFAAALLFDYVASFLYEGDAPLAERRAQALALDHAQLKELLGEAALRELLDREVIAAHERRLLGLDGRFRARHPDQLHDLLLRLGDLTEEELAARTEGPPGPLLEPLLAARRVLRLTIAGEPRYAAVEDAARLRDGLGVALPPDLPAAFLEPRGAPLEDLVARYARTHGPFTAEEVALRLGRSASELWPTLVRLAERGRLVEGEMRPGGRGLEWCDAEVLGALERQSLAKLRREVEPVEPAALARFAREWHGLARPRRGLDALLRVIEQLQGAPLVASALEAELLPARIAGYQPADLDQLALAGEIVWRGLEPLAGSDGRLALYLADGFERLAPPPSRVEGELPERIRQVLLARGALFFQDLARHTGAFPPGLAKALWALVWSGEVTNDTLAPVRGLLIGSAKVPARALARGRALRLGRSGPPGTEGRWRLLPPPGEGLTETERRAALARQLLDRHGVLTKEAVHAEGHPGGFQAVYPVLAAMEQAGKVRRGYFVAGLGAAQFAVAGAEERLRAHRDPGEAAEVHLLAATDPAHPFGAALPWPEREGAKPQRAAGAQVILAGGELLAYLGRTEKSLLTFLPMEEPERSARARHLARALGDLLGKGGRRALLVEKIDGEAPERSFLAPFLEEAGFSSSSRGFLKRRGQPT